MQFSSMLVPFGLTHFVERIPSCLGLDLERVLVRHTLYPVLRLLLPSFSALKIGVAVEAGTGVGQTHLGSIAQNGAPEIWTSFVEPAIGTTSTVWGSPCGIANIRFPG